MGLTGRNASGKTTVVQWFASRGVRTVSCSDSIRGWLSEQGTEESRESLIEGGRELRRRGGPGILAEMLLDELSGDDAVIDSIRTPGEVEVLRTRGDFVLIEVRAGADSRRRRRQSGDPDGDSRQCALALCALYRALRSFRRHAARLPPGHRSRRRRARSLSGKVEAATRRTSRREYKSLFGSFFRTSGFL